MFGASDPVTAWAMTFNLNWIGGARPLIPAASSRGGALQESYARNGYSSGNPPSD